MVVCLGFVLSMTTVHASSDDKFKKIYHVYVENEYIGKVDDKSVVQQVATKKLGKLKGKYEDLDLILGESIDIVPEKVFNPSYENDDVRDELKDILTVEAQSYAIVIDDEEIGYFATEESAEDALKKYKLEYVKKSDLKSIEDKRSHKSDDKKEDEQTEIAVGDKVVQDITFSEDVSIVEKKIEPKEIIDAKQGLKLLSKGTLEDKKHTVVEGDVFEKIADEYDLTTEELLELNPDLNADSILQIDQELNVTVLESYTEVVVEVEEVKEKTAKFETEIIESDDLYKGEEEVKQSGKDGKKEVHYKIEKKNGEETKREVLNEKFIEEPIDEVIIKGTKVIPSRGSGNLSWPVDGGYISSKMGERWGRMHKGIDIAQPNTRTITAADHGVVESVGYQGGYGNKIVIDHNNGMKTIYAHLSSMDVRVGQTVEKGMKIGVMGTTGNSTGIHLHFEVHQDGSLENPLDYF